MTQNNHSLAPSSTGLESIMQLFSGARNFWAMIALLVFVVAMFSMLSPATFLRPATFQSMLYQIPELGLLALAMGLPIIAGGLNLAIVATTNQVALLMAFILIRVMPPEASGAELWMWIGLAFAAGFALSLVIGVVTGAIISVVGVHPILATLGTMTLLGGINVYMTRGTTLAGLPDPIVAISNTSILGLPISFVIMGVTFLLINYLLTTRPAGARVFLVGSSQQAARYSGISLNKTLIMVYTISSVLCWLAAIVMMARFNSAGADFAQSYLLISIIAAILGGIDPNGGFGRLSGLFLALIVLQVIASGFNGLGISSQLTVIFWGLTLIFVAGVRRLYSIVAPYLGWRA